jgi:hypothetical protein
VIGFITGCVFAFEGASVDGKILEHGYYDVAKVDKSGKFSISSWDSVSGVYLFIESGWDGPCCVSPYYTRFSIGRNLNSKTNDSIWVLTDFSGIDSLNEELKKGKSLSLGKFTKLEFDSTHVQYLVHGTNRPVDVKKKRDYLDSLKLYDTDSLENLGNQEYLDYLNLLPEIYFADYFLYRSGNAVTALCGVIHSVCYYKIGCFYQNDGSFVFDSLPEPSKMSRTMGCLDGIGSFIRPKIRNPKKEKRLNNLYKINGSSSFKGSSNIVIQNKQPMFQLKGN